MPWTLYRFILRDLLKLLTISTVVLIVVMSVASTIPYIADDLLGPLSMLKFIGYTVPTMLSLALPFAAAFASTLVFNRMVTDNEILICRASGLNYLLILLPVLFLGAALLLGMFYLSNWMIPQFYERAEHTLERDVLSLMVHKVQQGEYVRHDDLILYADQAVEAAPPAGMEVEPGIVPQRLVAFEGVAVAELDDKDRLRADGTAERADLLLYHAGDESWIMVMLRNAHYYGADREASRGVMEEMPLGPYRVENPFRAKIRFFSWPELRRLKLEPELDRDTGKYKQRLVHTIVRERMMRTISDGLLHRGRVVLESSVPGETYEIRASRIERQENALVLMADGDKRVEIDQYAHGVISERRFHARRAVVSIDVESYAEPRVDMRLSDVAVLSTREQGRGTERTTLMMPLMRDPRPVAEPLRNTSMLQLMTVARTEYGQSEAISRQVDRTHQRITLLLHEAKGELHERAALAVGCLLMILLGAVMSMKLEGRLPLVAYFWAFVFSACAVAVTRTGGRMITGPGLPYYAGVMVIWSGNLIVAVAVLMSYWRLEKA
jgi:lipopolysaccharide export LptBFGC system permease protein LptF